MFHVDLLAARRELPSFRISFQTARVLGNFSRGKNFRVERTREFL